MATKTWTGKGHSWTDPNAWTPDAPGTTDTALFTSFPYGTVAGNDTVGALFVKDHAEVTFNGTVELTQRLAVVLDDFGSATLDFGGVLRTGGSVVVGQSSSNFGELKLVNSNAGNRSGDVIIGQGGTAVGRMELVGSGLSVASFMTVGAGGTGDLSLSAGAFLSLGFGDNLLHGDLTIGKGAQSLGTVSLNAASYIDAGGTVRVGVAGTGFLLISNQSDVAAGTLDVAGTGHVVLADGDVNGLITTLAAGATISGSGGLGGDTIDNEGTITAQGTLYITGDSVGSTVSGAGTLEITQGSDLVINANILALQHIAFAGTDAQLTIGPPSSENQPLHTIAAPITGFAGSDALQLEQASGALSYDADTEILSVQVSSVVERFQFQGLSGGAAFHYVASASGPKIELAVGHS